MPGVASGGASVFARDDALGLVENQEALFVPDRAVVCSAAAGARLARVAAFAVTRQPGHLKDWLQFHRDRGVAHFFLVAIGGAKNLHAKDMTVWTPRRAEDPAAQVGGLEIAEVLPFDRLKADEVSVLFSHIPAEDRLAATLTCKSLNKARAGKPMKTSTLAMLRSEPLQAWAATLGCPLYPYWAELYGLQGVAMYNGRVGRVLGPPNEKGRYPFELDAGMGELPRRKDGVRSKTLKYITVKPSNVHPLTSLDDERGRPARRSAKVTIEAMVRDYRLSPGCAWMLRALPPDKQKLAARIDPAGQADPSGYVAEQLKRIV
jgi:hypothetical protein